MRKGSMATLRREPLKPTGCLDKFEFVEVTPRVGREYKDLTLADLVHAPNSDELIRELGIIISHRGVVFFRDQEMTLEEQKILTQKLGLLTGKPSDAGLHVHPAINARTSTVVHEEAQADKHAFLVSNRLWDVYFAKPKPADPEMAKKNRNMANQWHSDLMFETVPADYSFLRMLKHPPTGGDTLWASSVEMYDRMSRPFQKYLQSLTIQTSSQDKYMKAEDLGHYKLYTEPRGHPLNSGKKFYATFPVVRTNPVTGLNSVYGVGLHVKHINDVTKAESDHLLQLFLDTITRNHDMQVRFKWEPKSCAIWDNRSVYHAATLDVDNKYERLGIRVTSIGEEPYLDPAVEVEVNGHT